MKIARIPVSSEAGVPALVRWVKRTHPGIYMELDRRMQGQLMGLGLVAPAGDNVKAAASQPSMWANITSTLKELVAVAAPVYQQKKIFDMQIKRAEAGQQLLDTSAISDISSVKVGMDASTRNTALWIAGALALAFIGGKALGLFKR